jgi:hypothetical protein
MSIMEPKTDPVWISGELKPQSAKETLSQAEIPFTNTTNNFSLKEVYETKATIFMEQSHWEAMMKFYHHVHISLLSVPVLGKINSVHAPPIHFLSDPRTFKQVQLRKNLITGW